MVDMGNGALPGSPGEARNAIGQALAEGSQKADHLAEQLQAIIHDAVDQGGEPAEQVKSFLHGTWLGHPLHPVLTDVPVGAWTVGLMMDLTGQDEAADAVILAGVLAAIPTAVAGLADWSETSGEPRRAGFLHGALNVAALSLFAGSLAARRAKSRALGVGLSTAGLAIASLSAWIGGDLVYRDGTGVNYNAFRSPGAEDFQVAAKLADLKPGQLNAGEITVDGEKRPLVLYQDGGEILAIGGICTHVGGPLAEGKLVNGDCVECPWHGSWFSLRDGSARRGPATASEPAYETRVRDGNVEVRLVK